MGHFSNIFLPILTYDLELLTWPSWTNTSSRQVKSHFV